MTAENPTVVVEPATSKYATAKLTSKPKDTIDGTTMVEAKEDQDDDTDTELIEENITIPPNSSPLGVSSQLKQSQDSDIINMTLDESNTTVSNTDDNTNSKKSLSTKQLEKLERQKRRELEAEERRKKKEAEKLEKEQKRLQKEKERLEKKQKEEREKEIKKRKREEEAVEREAKKRKIEEGKLEKKKKLEEERLEKKKKFEEEKLKKAEERSKKQQEKDAKKTGALKDQTSIAGFFKVKNKQPDIVNNLVKKSQSDYQTFFLQFHTKENCFINKIGQLNDTDLKDSKDTFDSSLNEEIKDDNKVFSWLSEERKTRGLKSQLTAEQINTYMSSEELNVLQNLTFKYIQFYENKKPPYCGSWSKPIHIPATNPYYQLENIDYDYDSDLEWGEDEGEGDEVDDGDDDEEDMSLDGDDDFGEFVDDDGNLNKRRLIAGQLEPRVETNNEMTVNLFSNMTANILLENIENSVDPLKNYWGKEPVFESAETKVRIPINSKTVSLSTTVNTLTARKKAAPIDNVEDIKVVVNYIYDNNDFALATLTDMLKRQLSIKGYKQASIKSTVQNVAFKKNLTAKWEIKTEFEQYLPESKRREEQKQLSLTGAVKC